MAAKTTRPAWLTHTMLRGNTAIPGDARDGHSRPMHAWAEDLSDADRTADAFRSSLDRYLARRWAHDRSAAIDQAGGLTHAQRRRQELEQIPGAGHLALQYGLHMAKDRTLRDMQLGLRVDNPNSSRYQRSFSTPGLIDDCLKVYASQGHDHPSNKLLFVNSKINAMRVLEKLRRDNFLAFSRGIENDTLRRIKNLGPGLVAIEFASSDYAQKGETAVVQLGARPSVYEVGKLAHQVRHPAAPQTRTRDGIDNANMLRKLLIEDHWSVISALGSLPPGHAMQLTANCVASLLDGLGKTLLPQADTPRFQHDALVANALNALANAARALPSLCRDSTRFFAAYAVLLEEMHLLLAAARPYSERDFKDAAAAVLQARAGSTLAELRIATPETFLLSSGMDAISIGTNIARMLSGSMDIRFLANQTPAPDYFETLPLISTWDTDRVRMAPLNSNLPWRKGIDDTVNDWSAGKLLQLAQQWMESQNPHPDQPAVLVLDAAIEKPMPRGTSDLAMVLAGLKSHINDGRLKIVLCKSYQKYASLDSAKIMAGAITLIAGNDERTQTAIALLRQAEADLDWMRNDESQLLTHFLTHAHASELEMIGRAAENAAFIDRFCLAPLHHAGNFDVRHESGLPFVVTPVVNQQVAFATKTGSRFNVLTFLERQVASRDSFAFLPTSLTTINDTTAKLRIAAGQETREELVEKLHAFAWLGASGLQKITPARIAQAATEIAASAMRAVIDQVDVMIWARTALQVLRERASGGSSADAAALGECKHLLDDILAMQKSAQAHDGGRREECKSRLREKLKTALDAHDPRTHALLRECLRIVGSAFAPRLAPDSLAKEDIDAMLAALRHDPDLGREESAPDALFAADGLIRARYAPNAVASLLALAGLGFGPEEVNDDLRDELESFYSAVLASGLAGVSPSTRTHLVLDWSRLHMQRLQSASSEQTRRSVDALVRHVHLSPYRETGAKILALISDAAFARLERPVQRQLIDALFAPLDAAARLEFIRALACGHRYDRLNACVERFEEDLRKSDEGISSMLFPDVLTGGSEPASDSPRPLTAKERDAIRKELLAILPPRDAKTVPPQTSASS